MPTLRPRWWLQGDPVVDGSENACIRFYLMFDTHIRKQHAAVTLIIMWSSTVRERIQSPAAPATRRACPRSVARNGAYPPDSRRAVAPGLAPD